MSDDPETRRQIAELAKDDRPLLALDVDEVVLEFVRPFASFLDHEGFDFRTDSFRLNGNIILRQTGTPAEPERVALLLDGFFAAQDLWQTAADGAAAAIASLAGEVEIVLLTAMPHAHRARRRALLDRLGFPYPVVTTEKPKGPAVEMLRGATRRPVAFVDDIPHNLASVRKSVPDAALFHLMAHAGLRTLLPPLPQDVVAVADWCEAGERIGAALLARPPAS